MLCIWEHFEHLRDWSSNTGQGGARGGVVVSYTMEEGINFVPYKNGDVEQVLAEEGGGGGGRQYSHPLKLTL